MEKKKFFRNMIIFMAFMLVVMGATYYFSHNYLVIFPIKGESMENTLYNEDKVLLFKTKKVKYDDVFIFYHESATTEDSKYLVKRVIGLEGDEIEIKYSYEDSLYHVYRNGKVLKDEYIKEDMDRNYVEMSMTVPKGKVFFLGDNRLHSLDSHLGLLADVDKIQGVALIRYSSWKDIKIL